MLRSWNWRLDSGLQYSARHSGIGKCYTCVAKCRATISHKQIRIEWDRARDCWAHIPSLSIENDLFNLFGSVKQREWHAYHFRCSFLFLYANVTTHVRSNQNQIVLQTRNPHAQYTFPSFRNCIRRRSACSTRYTRTLVRQTMQWFPPKSDNSIKNENHKTCCWSVLLLHLSHDYRNAILEKPRTEVAAIICFVFFIFSRSIFKSKRRLYWNWIFDI